MLFFLSSEMVFHKQPKKTHTQTYDQMSSERKEREGEKKIIAK